MRVVSTKSGHTQASCQRSQGESSVEGWSSADGSETVGRGPFGEFWDVPEAAAVLEAVSNSPAAPNVGTDGDAPAVGSPAVGSLDADAKPAFG